MQKVRSQNIKVSAGSIIGGRKENQDNLMIDSRLDEISSGSKGFYCEGIMSVENEKRYFVVCDGMGGRSNGAEASQIAIKSFRDNLQELKINGSPVDIMKLLIELNDKIIHYFQINEKRGGTTISIVQVNKDETIEVFNIGDSPVMLMRDGNIKLISEEQSVAGMKLKRGRISEKEYEHSNEKNLLLGYLGDFTTKSLKNTFYSGKIKYQQGDVILVSSDGLIGAINKQRLNDMISFGVSAKELLEEGKKKKNSDNITIIMLEML